jgi:hypothetical protein
MLKTAGRRPGILRIALATVSIGAVVGCSGGSGAKGTGGSGAGTGGAASGTGGSVGTGTGGASAEAKFAPCSTATRVGGFTLELVHEVAATGATSATPPHAKFGGSIYDSVKPDAVWPELDHAGTCRVVVGADLACATACVSGEVCAGNNVCRAAPKAKSVGAVSVTGLNDPLASMPTKTNLYYETFATDAAYPPFTVGGTVNLSAAGDAYPAFAMAARGIAPLEMDTHQSLVVASGKSITLTWSPPPTGGAGRITTSMDIGHHNGSTAAHLDCDFPDTGSATIPASLVTTLISRGVAGFPDMEVARVSVDSTMIASGCIQWAITAPLKVPLTLEGTTSCHEDVDCPSTAPTCRADLTCGP